MTTLREKIETGTELTHSEAQSLAELVGKRCRAAKKARIAVACSMLVSRGAIYGLYSRVQFEHGQAYYCAGQSYPDEIRTLRETILS